MEIGDKVKVESKNGNSLFTIDEITDKTIHFKNKKNGLKVNKDRVRSVSKSWRGAKFIYISFN